MATSPLLASLVQAMGAGGASGPPGQPPDAGNVSQMASELHGADPAFLLKTLMTVKKNLSDLFTQTTMRLPNVAGNIAKTITQLDRAIKEAQQAASTQSVVRSPLGFSLAGGDNSSAPAGGAGIGGF